MKQGIIIGLILICTTCKKEVVDYRDKYVGIYKTTMYNYYLHQGNPFSPIDSNTPQRFDTLNGYSYISKVDSSSNKLLITFNSDLKFFTKDSAMFESMDPEFADNKFFIQIDDTGKCEVFNCNSFKNFGTSVEFKLSQSDFTFYYFHNWLKGQATIYNTKAKKINI